MSKHYILVDRLKIVAIEEEALKKALANQDRPLSEASIEARAVLETVGYLYMHDEWIDSPQDIPAIENTLLAKDALIRELRKGYIDMALIIEQLTTKDLTEDDIKDMKERADRLKENIK
jgi:hypothetical protein